MSFDDRNAVWTGVFRSFVQAHSRTSAPRKWKISVVGNQVITEWGQDGGKMQTATETFQGVNVGKSNEMSPAAYALDRAKEMTRKKNWEGYREEVLMVDGQGYGVLMDVVVSKDLTDFHNLPLSLCFYKPDNSMGAGITKKAEAGKAWYARKRNGLMFVISRGFATAGNGSCRLYSRRMLRQHDDEKTTELTWDDRFEHIIEAANRIIPPHSLILGELIMDRDGVDDFKHVQSITKSLTAQSLQDQMTYGRPSFYCWDIAFWEREEIVKCWTVRDRYTLIHDVIDAGRIIQPVQFFDNTAFPLVSQAVDAAKHRGWEGFVVVDPDGVYGDKAYNFKGKPDRPGSVCAKLKPEFEDDFIAYWDPDNVMLHCLPGECGERSQKERNGQGIKSVALYQRNSKGELVYISNVSSGLTDAMKRDLANPEMFPQVWKVLYTERTYKSEGDDTNALTFARYDSTRMDKSPDECINTEL